MAQAASGEPTTGKRMSLGDIAAKLADAGHKAKSRTA
jgi:hypothetical protein